MTEQEWLISGNSDEMLDWMTWAHQGSKLLPRPSDRKLHLYACACVRRIWHLLTNDRSRRAVQVAEWFADGDATVEEMDAAWGAACDAARAVPPAPTVDAMAAARAAARAGMGGVVLYATKETARAAARAAKRTDQEKAAQATLLRNTLGNPWRSVEFRPEWRTPDVLSIGRAAYIERAPDGTIEQDSLLVLSDALEEVGCGDELLTALRSPGPHYRGFWALDVILGNPTPYTPITNE